MSFGKIVLINPIRGLFAVQIEPGDFTVFHLLDTCEIDIGDVISGDLDADGDETLYNKTKDEEFDAYIEGWGCNLRTARTLLGLK